MNYKRRVPMEHRCSDLDCPHYGQRTTKSCGCHVPSEQLALQAVADLLQALKVADAALTATLDGRGYKSGASTDGWAAEVAGEVRARETVRAAIASVGRRAW